MQIKMASALPSLPWILLLNAYLIITRLDLVAGQNFCNHHFSKASCKFAVDLLKTVSLEGDENIVISPSSIGVLLAILQQGARHNTLTQLNNLLQMTPEVSRNEYHSALQLLQAKKGSNILEWGSRAYVKPGSQIKTDFNLTISEYFGAAIEELNFTDPSTNAAADKINKWIEYTTHGVIKGFIPPSIFNPDTMLVLLNAIYFKGLWDKPFEKVYTKTNRFEISPESFVDVPFMHRRKKSRAGKNDKIGFSWVQLQFKGKKFSMLFILPTQKHSLAEVLNGFDGEVLRKIIHSHHSINVNMNIPKFKLNQKNSLNSALSQLGLTDIFQPVANLSGITPTNLQVSEILHEASVEIDEEGSVAAGASGIVLVGSSLETEETLDFTANHPFLFFIIDKLNKIPLFMGKVFDPSA